MDSPETAIGVSAAAALAYLWHVIRTDRSKQKQEVVDRRWVERMEQHARKTYDLTNQVTGLLGRVDRVETRMDKNEDEFDKHVQDDVLAHERVARLEEQSKDVREALENMMKHTESLLADMLHELRLMRAKG